MLEWLSRPRATADACADGRLLRYEARSKRYLESGDARTPDLGGRASTSEVGRQPIAKAIN